MIELATIDVPEFGAAPFCPEIPAGLYESRLKAACGRLRQAGLDCSVVYADREHFANLSYLTGFDPRFEEALLLLDVVGRRMLVVGNECMGFLPDPQLGCEVVLFQEFSLLGQPRGDSRPLCDILASFGIKKGSRVGCVGWKYFDGALIAGGPQACDLPAYVVDLLRDVTGDPRNVVNATAIFMNPADGLRTTCEPVQIAQFEVASAFTSEGVRAVLQHLREGVEEESLEHLLHFAGLPLSCHRMIGFGAKARRGLASPSPNRAHLGNPFTVGFGLVGALTCRAGCIASGPADLPAGDRQFFADLAADYFDVVCTWYEQVRVGALGSEVFSAVEGKRDPRLYRFAVNPGHLLHLDEWLHSPFAAHSPCRLRSGMAIQMDIIPVSTGPFFCINAEDGIVLADEHLRRALAEEFPACWQRIEARRLFMRQTVGIELHESVLPLSNIPAWLPPYAMSLEKAFVKR
ncbi:MAG: hypothetical protein ABSG53_28455 [Thermoguttaceae bacterium]